MIMDDSGYKDNDDHDTGDVNPKGSICMFLKEIRQRF